MQAKNRDILFLNLYTFGLTGGIEKVCRNFIAALNQIFSSEKWVSYSLYDNEINNNTEYGQLVNQKVFKGNKIKFIFQSIRAGYFSRTVILSHINLLIVAKLIAIISPKKRYILFAHGIEVWHRLPKWKVNFLKSRVEIWAVSCFTKQVLIDNHCIPQENIKILNNCLSPKQQLIQKFEKPVYLIERHQLNNNIPILFTLNRLSSSEKYKGYDKVIEALSVLKEEGVYFTYLLAGKADELERARVDQLIKDNCLDNNVKLIGFVDDKEIEDYYLLADIFIMPSRGEGFGLVFIEAAACGCQVIGGNADGSVDALLQGKLGQLVNPTDEEEIKQAIVNAINNKNHRPEEQQRMVIEHFGFEQYVKRVRTLLS